MSQQQADSEPDPSPTQDRRCMHVGRSKEQGAAAAAAAAALTAGGAQRKEKPAPAVLPLAPAGLQLAARRALASLGKEASRQRRAHRPEEGRQGRQRKSKRVVTVDSSKAKTSAEALKICIQQLKWKEFPAGRRLLCDIYWHGVSFHDGEVSCSGQVNKYPGMMEMVRKVNFSRAVRTMQELFPDEYKFYPRSWILPEEYQNFADQVKC